MCGFGAILRADGEPIPDAWVDAIDARIAHRGPDGHGRFRDRVKPRGRPAVEVALVHRRLAVIDPDGGAQPMVSKQGRKPKEGVIAVVFNGCIYNHRELRRKLKAAGHTFVTDHSDTEVLIAGHRQWGERLQEQLEGMYAYAIWDRKAASLTLARDWFGEKPLYHHVEADGEGVKLLIASSDAQAAAPPPRKARASTRRSLGDGCAGISSSAPPGAAVRCRVRGCPCSTSSRATRSSAADRTRHRAKRRTPTRSSG